AGISQDATIGVTESDLTSPGTTVGTVAYMSPEQVRAKELDSRTDLFSFGAVLYEMATGTLPFRGESSGLIFDAILNRAPIAPIRLNPDVPAELERIVNKALEKDRNLRYQSAAEMRADLLRLKRETDSSSSRSLAPARSKRRRLAMWSAVAVAIVLLAAGAVQLWRPTRTSSIPDPSQWVQLTSFVDESFEPALSPDGRMLAFLRGSGRAAQVYVKLLPDGEPVQLTHAEVLKTMPAFSPDGSRIAYGVAGHNWQTWVVPVLGGQPQLLLSNAAGLTWIDPQHVMFSEIKSGVHLSVVTSTESRSEQRDVYVPLNQDDMAHVSYLSPDRKWVLVVEMESDGRMGQCRLAPFSGNRAVRLVGPPKGGCDYAAWSPDGKWMYFSSDAGAHGYHIWQQAFPDGSPQQLTAGLTEEDGLAIAPDGHSIITSVGTLNGGVWVHDQHGERQISSEGFCYRPKLTTDGRHLFYLRAENESGEDRGGELWAADLATGESSKVLPGIAVLTFSLSLDGKRVVFDTLETGGKHRLWLASTEHLSAPHSIGPGIEGSYPMYSRSGRIYFESSDKQPNAVYRVSEDGTGEQKLYAGLDYATGISPDERFMAVRRVVNPDNDWMQADAVPTSGGPPVPLCSGWCGVDWTRDGKAMYFYWMSSWSNIRTYVVPIAHGTDLPNLPKNGFQ